MKLSLTPFVVLVALLFTLAAPLQAQNPAVAEGQALLRSGDTKAALALFEKAVATTPKDASAWFFVGYCRHMLGDIDGALPAHQKAAELGTGQTQQLALYNTACVYSLKGDLDQAFAWLERLEATGYNDTQQLSTDPDLANARADRRWESWLELAAATPSNLSPFRETDVQVLQRWTGKSAGEQFGWVSADAGDVDGDGFADAVVGAAFFGGAQVPGRVYVASGKSGAFLFEITGTPGDRLGNAVDGAGDLDGDGRADFVAGAPGHAGSPGRALVYSGRDGRVLVEMRGEANGDLFGDEVRMLGDLDGDGKPDYLVGAEKHDGPAGADAGRVYICSGADGHALATLEGESAGDLFGSSSAGAIVAGQPFVVVGAMNAGPGQRGRVYAFKGQTLERAFVIEGDATAVNYGRFFLSLVGDVNRDGTLDVYSSDFENAAKGPNTGRAWVHSGVDGSLIFEWTGGAAGAGFGIGNAEAGDQNGDGVPDLVIGAWQNSQGAPQGGKVYVFSGADGSLLRTLTGGIAGDALGFDATGIGDLDGDGVRELLVTAAYHAVPNAQNAGAQTGATYIVRGGVPKSAEQ